MAKVLFLVVVAVFALVFMAGGGCVCSVAGPKAGQPGEASVQVRVNGVDVIGLGGRDTVSSANGAGGRLAWREVSDFGKGFVMGIYKQSEAKRKAIDDAMEGKGPKVYVGDRVPVRVWREGE